MHFYYFCLFFINAKVRQTRIFLKAEHFNSSFTGYEYFLKTERNCGHNSAIKYITNFKKIVRIAYANDWIDKDPFFNWKAKLKIVDREFLSKEEIEKIIKKDVHIPRLELVRDIFREASADFQEDPDKVRKAAKPGKRVIKMIPYLSKSKSFLDDLYNVDEKDK